MARLVVFTSGTLGDHLPYLALAQGLQRRGHDLLLVINQAMHAYAGRAGLQAVALTDIARGPEEARQNAWAWDHWRNPWFRAAQHPNAQAQSPGVFVRQAGELAGFLGGADLLLSTSIRPHGLAAHLISGVPWLTLSVNPSAFALRREEIRERGWADRAHYQGVRPLIDRAVREAGGRRLTPGWYFGCLWAPHVLLGGSKAFFEADATLLQPFSSLEQTGFWQWEDPAWAAWQAPPELEAFMARRPIVLAFSSQPLEEPREILHKHVRAAAGLGLPLLVQRGWAGFDEGDLPPGSDGAEVMFLDYAPHDWLFARASAAIQHGGIGSLARAARQFCPLIIEPFGNDQFFNGQRTADLGIGVQLHPFEATAEDIAAAVQAALSRAVRLRSRILGRRLREEDGVAEAADLVEAALARQAAGTLYGGWGRRPLAGAAGGVERGAAMAASAEIPRILHQTWKEARIPEHFQAWHESWRHHHPDWTFKLWTDEACRALVAEHYAWFLPIYDGYAEPIMRADAARCFVLHHHGGVYADLDYEALRPLDPLLANRRLLLTTEPPLHQQTSPARRSMRQILCNALMGSAPGHPFWVHLFEQLPAWSSAPGPLDATGPHLLSRAYDSYEGKDKEALVPYDLLCPISNQELWPALPEPLREIIQRDAYAIHHWFGSWWQEAVVTDGPAALQLLVRGQMPAGAQRVTREQLLAYSAGMAQKPLVSCLMVTRERPLLAQLAIHAFLQQSYASRELIVIDDAADDALQRWVEENGDARLRYFHVADEGRPLGELRNLALAKARGAFVAQWDDDDLSAPLRLELQMAAMALLGARACLLPRQLLWLPAAGALAKSTRRLWEGSAILPWKGCAATRRSVGEKIRRSWKAWWRASGPRCWICPSFMSIPFTAATHLRRRIGSSTWRRRRRALMVFATRRP